MFVIIPYTIYVLSVHAKRLRKKDHKVILKTLIKKERNKMVKNHCEEQNVICSDCGEEVEIEYTKFCANEIVCLQCIIDSGGDHIEDDRDAPFDANKYKGL